MEEQIGLLRQLWGGVGDPFEGKFHNLPAMEMAPVPVQHPAPPIWITNKVIIVGVCTEPVTAHVMMTLFGVLAITGLLSFCEVLEVVEYFIA